MAKEEMEARLRELRAAARDREAKEQAFAEEAAAAREIARRELDARVAAALDENGWRSALDKTMKRVDVDYADGTPIGVVLMRAPSMPTWRAFVNKIDEAKGTEKDQLAEKLWRPCLVWPSEPEVEDMIAKQPHVRERLCNAVADMAGVRASVIEGKS